MQGKYMKNQELTINQLEEQLGLSDPGYFNKLLLFHLKFAFEKVEKKFELLDWPDHVEDALRVHQQKVQIISDILGKYKERFNETGGGEG